MRIEFFVKMPKNLIFPKKLESVVVRHEKNPIIQKKDVPFASSYIFNAGAIKHRDRYLLLLRVQDLQMRSHLALATSQNGIDFIMPSGYSFSPSFSSCDNKGVEDPRITQIDNKFYIAYTAYSDHGASVGLAETENFKEFKGLGIILPPENKDAVLLPEKRHGKYLLYHRPTRSRSMWTCSSFDLIHWGEHKPVLRPDSRSWDSDKVGAGAVPIKTKKGWLHIYHGISGDVYRLGVALFDLENPSKLIRRSKNYVLSPEKDYEMIGGVPNVVFTCGAIREDNDEVKIYYGAADTSICLATAKLSDLVEIAEKY